MNNKKQLINDLIRLLENEDNILNDISIINEHEELHKLGMIESVLTGNRTITINLLNKSQHMKFLEKLQGMR